MRRSGKGGGEGEGGEGGAGIRVFEHREERKSQEGRKSQDGRRSEGGKPQDWLRFAYFVSMCSFIPVQVLTYA